MRDRDLAQPPSYSILAAVCLLHGKERKVSRRRRRRSILEVGSVERTNASFIDREILSHFIPDRRWRMGEWTVEASYLARLMMEGPSRGSNRSSDAARNRPSARNGKRSTRHVLIVESESK